MAAEGEVVPCVRCGSFVQRSECLFSDDGEPMCLACREALDAGAAGRASRARSGVWRGVHGNRRAAALGVLPARRVLHERARGHRRLAGVVVDPRRAEVARAARVELWADRRGCGGGHHPGRARCGRDGPAVPRSTSPLAQSHLSLTHTFEAREVPVHGVVCGTDRPLRWRASYRRRASLEVSALAEQLHRAVKASPERLPREPGRLSSTMPPDRGRLAARRGAGGSGHGQPPPRHRLPSRQSAPVVPDSPPR